MSPVFSGALRCFLGFLLSACVATAFAQGEAIKLVLPFGPGSGTDVYARLVAQQLSLSYGSPVVVENRPGANGVVAAESVARAKPDGTTFFFTTNSTHAANPYLVKDLRYDPIKDFTPVTKAGTLIFFVMVAASGPHQDLKSLIAAAKADPKAVSYGAQNSLAIVSGSKLAKVGGVEFLRVPYKSTPQVITDMLGGQVTFGFVDMAAGTPLVKSGKLRPIAVLGEKRFPALPNVPTMSEAGFPDFDVVAWFGIFAPAGTAPAIVARMNKEFKAVVAQPEIRQKAAELGIDMFASTPEELAAYVRSQLALWEKLVADAGLKPE